MLPDSQRLRWAADSSVPHGRNMAGLPNMKRPRLIFLVLLMAGAVNSPASAGFHGARAIGLDLGAAAVPDGAGTNTAQLAPPRGEIMTPRPDMAPPSGVVGGMSPPAGRLMLALRYMRMRMDGNRDGTSDVGTAAVLVRFPVTPVRMDVDAAVLGAAYGVTDKLFVGTALPYLHKERDHRTRAGGSFTTRSGGLGDARVMLGVTAFAAGRHTLRITGGISLPTGSIDERDDTPAGTDQLLPYPMQNGSGTVDFLPAATYSGRAADYSWGLQGRAAVRLGTNDRSYRLGNAYQATVWGARKWTGSLSSSLRVIGETQENIDGADPRLNPLQVPTADPKLRGGERVSIGIGVNLVIPSGALRGVGLSAEGILPVFQDLDGPQLERDYAIVLGLRKAF